jgi:1-acyl-sn-glycerol-3-phosphate acyltransferase
MKAHWFYYIVKYLSWVGLKLFFGGVKVIGKENLPKDGAFLYAPNHQGAFMDAMVTGSNANEPVSFLTRADIFNKWTTPFLSSLNMMAIYRMRDGVNSIALNEKVFEKCSNMLIRGESILIFPEGNHTNEYYLRPLKKGAARLAMMALDKVDRKKKIYIIPTGINYFSHSRPLAKVRVEYGKAIDVDDYMDLYYENEQTAYAKLRQDLEVAMKKTMILPEKDEHYQEKISYIFQPKHQDLPLDELKKMGRSDHFEVRKQKKSSFITSFFIAVFSIPNILPLLLLKKVLSGIKDKAFYTSLKFLIGGILHILWWITLFSLGFVWLSWQAGVLFASTALLMMYARQELIRY